MLKVERKKPRKPNGKKWFVVLVAATLSLAALTCLLLRAAGQDKREGDTPAALHAGGSLVNRGTDEIRKIMIRVRDRDAWEAERDETGNLRMVGDGEWILDRTLGERIEDALANLVFEEVLTGNEEDYLNHQEEFGLADPALTAVVSFTDGTSLEIHIGDPSGIADRDYRYMTVKGDPRLFAVAGSLWEDLSIERELLHPVVQPEIRAERIDRISILNAKRETQVEWILRKTAENQEDGRWEISVPVQYPADQEQMEKLLKNAANLRLGVYIGTGNRENLAEYGLEQPQFILDIHMAGGSAGRITEAGTFGMTETTEESLQFALGNRRNEMTDFCLYDGCVYSMNHFSSAALTETDPVSTAERFPFTVPAERLSSLKIERRAGNPDLYELKDTGTAGEVQCLKNGKEITYTAFRAAYDRMLEAGVSGQLPKGWDKKETEVCYVIRTRTGETHTVELSEFDSLHDAVTVDGQSLFYLIRNGLGELP